MGDTKGIQISNFKGLAVMSQTFSFFNLLTVPDT
jgi:hypothetical protein